MNNLSILKIRKPSTGFSLIEVLIALIILSVGLLGMAGLQVSSLRGAHDAELSSQAVNLTSGIAERMRVNRSEWANYATTNKGQKSASITYTNCATNTCSASQATNFDLFVWKNNIESYLPGGEGDIQEIGNDIVITTSWLDRGTAKQYALRIR